jgi:peroxidase
MKPFISVLSLFAALATLVAGNGTPSGGSGCALIVSGPPPRTSAFDGASHAFGGSRPPHNPESTCITYDAVSAAFDQAKYQERLQRVKGKFSNEQVGALSMVIEETTRILAQQYSLSRDAVANGLPLIDTTKTSIEDYCPDFLMTPKCEVERYRSQEGLCNNLNMPHWGAAMHGHDRVLTPDFAGGINAPRISITGQPLPSARVVSQAVHNGEERHDHAVTLLLVIWGQYIDHDITLTAEVKDHRTGKAPKCCDGDQHRKCLPIEVPHNDRFYSKYRQRCINFVRTHSGLSFNCRLGPKTSHNLITSFLDGSTSYANTDERLKLLRTYQGMADLIITHFGFTSKKVLF